MSYEFLFTSLIVVLLPGAGVIYTVSTGLFEGWRASIAAAFGCTAGIVPDLLVSSLGLSTLLHTSALAFQVIRLVGAAYLLFLAWTMWRETGSLQFSAEQVKNRKLGSVVWKAILVNLLNPKLSVFFLSFLPLFIVPSSSSPIRQFLELSAVFMLMTLGIFILYGLFAHAVSGYLIRSTFWRVWLQRGFAVIFAGLGAKLVFSES